MSQFSEQILTKIDLYVTGKLSPVEATQFESEIATDVALQNEVSFQQDIVESIRMERTLQLKTKLQAIDVSSTSWWASKGFLGGSAAALFVGMASFMYWEYSKNDDTPFTHAMEKPVISAYEEYSETDAMANSTTATLEDANGESSSADMRASSLPNTTETEDNNTNINVNAPALTLNTEEEKGITTNSLASLDDLKSVEILNSAKANIDIQIVKKTKKLYYQFYDQKLFLFGNFDGSPYEVIEIDTHFGKEFYLKFDKSYYTIQNGIVDKTPLEKITNSALVEKLNELNH